MSHLLLLSAQGLMNMLRSAYEMDDNTHMSTLKRLVSCHTISRMLLHQLLEHLLVPSSRMQFIQDIELVRKQMATNSDEDECFKSEFIYYGASLSHLYYAKRNEKTGRYSLHAKSKPVFYSGPNEALSYVWLNMDAHGMIHVHQHYFVSEKVPNVLDCTVKRTSRLGDMETLTFSVVVGPTRPINWCARAWFTMNFGSNRAQLTKFDAAFLPVSFVVLLTSQQNMDFMAAIMVVAPECDLRQLPVSLHSTGP